MIQGTPVPQFFSDDTPVVQASFEACYELKQTWHTMEGVDVQAVLKSQYDMFFTSEGDINEAHLLKTIGNITKVGKGIDRKDSKAMQFFKDMFVYPYRCLKTSLCASMPVLEDVKTRYGHKIMASGVEEMKGGINNIILMAISGNVLIPQSYWGYFLDGPANISPIPHGPYYLIFEVEGISGKNIHPHNPSFDAIEHILVPFDEVKQQLLVHLRRVRESQLLSGAQYNAFIGKLKTYHEFSVFLDAAFDSGYRSEEDEKKGLDVHQCSSVPISSGGLMFSYKPPQAGSNFEPEHPNDSDLETQTIRSNKRQKKVRK